MQSLIAWTQKKERIERERERTILLRNSKKEIERKKRLLRIIRIRREAIRKAST